MNFDYEKHLVIKVMAGSHAYGTATENSDEDFRGVIIPPKEYFLGLGSFQQYCPDDGDICYYDIRKFFKLALQGNPNVIEIFKSPRLKVMNPWGGRILNMWDQIISKKLVKPHLGMARAHVARLHKPGKNCGIKGRDAIEKYGFNVKDASHVIRVLNQCLEILKTGKITLPRPEAEILLKIKQGRFSLQAIYAAETELSNQVKEWEKKSDLPDEPDYGKINKELIKITQSWIEWNDRESRE